MGLTCPECGADLRVAGISRHPRDANKSFFVVLLLALLLAWVLCGFALSAAVAALVPTRHVVQHTTRLAHPKSGAYQAIDVVSTGTAWGTDRPTMRAELRLTPAVTSAPPPGPGVSPSPGPIAPAANTPPPLAVNRGLRPEAVLAWLSANGVDTSDPRVQVEARTIARAAARSLRPAERAGPLAASAASAPPAAPAVPRPRPPPTPPPSPAPATRAAGTRSPSPPPGSPSWWPE
jgi:hypothetical protein